MRQFCHLMVAFALLTGLYACKTQTITEPATTVVQNTKPQPIQMILDSDFGSSTDDLFALMMLNHYIDEGLVDLKGIIVDREGDKNAGIVDIFNTYYGHPEIPIGLERNGVKNPRCFIPYNGICDLKDSQGQPLFKRSVDVSKCPDGYKLYRQLLSKADDGSIVIVAIGFATTLSQLFLSGADEYSSLNGVDLFGKKVKAVYIQSGRFEAGDSLCGYNMRAASRQSAIFYDKLPRNVDLIMSPSNIGDKMNYLPQDVLSDLSYTEVNPIKSVYTNYTCDTGQRMWDTNCLVNAVEGDASYHLSPRGVVTFVDKGEESLMLFEERPDGNARYQIPGDSYYNEVKLMDIRRHNRINKYPAPYTTEAPQPQLTGLDARAWAKPRTRLLADKYLGSAGNTLDPDGIRKMFEPIGFNGTNVNDYNEAVALMEDTLYTIMLDRTIRNGKTDLVIITGAPACGKTTALHQLNLKKAGLIYDAALTGPGRLEQVIAKAKQAGMKDVKLIMVYNDVMTCYQNTINRGKQTWRYVPLDYMVEAFRDNAGKLASIQQTYPDVQIIPIDMTGNKPMQQVSIEEALKWNHAVTDTELHDLLTYLLSEVNSGEIAASLLPSAMGNLQTIPGLNAENRQLAVQIDNKVRELLKAYERERQ
jgi:hypothetical protein